MEFIDSIVLPYVTVPGLGEDEYCETSRLIASYVLKPPNALYAATMSTNGIEIGGYS